LATIDDTRAILRDSLQLGARADALRPETRLLGSLPELDSMAVLTVLTAIEERFDITIEDDDINADTFATVASLCAFIDQKRAA
jgi:acyl carrier protein